MVAKTPKRSTPVTGIRQQAEARLRTTRRDIAAMPVQDVHQLVHELQVHQVELEMQNDELRRAQMELEAARDRYVDLYDSSPTGHLTLDTHGTIVEANLRAGTLLGLTRNKLIGHALANLIASSDVDTFHRHGKEVVKSGTRQTCEVQLLTKAGASRWVSFESLAVHEEPGRITHWRTALLDISDRKRAEEVILESQQRLNAVVEGTSDAVYVKDVTGRYLLFNSAAGRFVGKNPEEVLGHDDTYLFSHDDAQALMEGDRTVMAGGQTGTYEETVTTADGERRTFYSTKGPLLDANGLLAGLFGIARDIGERKMAESAVRQMMDTLDASRDGMCVFDAETLRFLYVNQGILMQTGYSREELLGMTPLNIQPMFDEPQLQNLLAPLRAKPGHARTFITVQRHKNGADFPVEIVLQCFAPQGQPAHYIAVVRDITERTQAEAALHVSQDQVRQMQKMEALGELAGGVAHDFNNILTAILGNAEVACMKLAVDHPSRLNLTKIIEAGDRASRLVQQILAFTHQQACARTVLALAPVVTEVLALLRATLPAGIELTSTVDAATPPVLADATQLHQVVMNLCTNAWHALGDQPGSIAVDLASVTVTQPLIGLHATLPPSHYACLSVRDTGCGMDPDTVARIFDPFFTTKSVGKGTGLGLSVVHDIVLGHEGAIVVDSHPGQGTTVRLYFPAKETLAATSESAEATPAQCQGRSRHLLYLDDEKTLVELVRAKLELLGYRVTGYTRPAEALEAVRADPAGIDVVVTDYNMPGLSGLEVARAVSCIRADLPVVLVSGYLSPTADAAILAAGIKAIVYKPDMMQQLGSVVTRLLDTPPHA